MAINTVMESGTVVMVSTPETAHEMAAESARLTATGICNIVFLSQEMADTWQKRCAAMAAHYKAMKLALQRQNDRNAKRRAKRRELAQAA